MPMLIMLDGCCKVHLKFFEMLCIVRISSVLVSTWPMHDKQTKSDSMSSHQKKDFCGLLNLVLSQRQMLPYDVSRRL